MKYAVCVWENPEMRSYFENRIGNKLFPLKIMDDRIVKIESGYGERGERTGKCAVFVIEASNLMGYFYFKHVLRKTNLVFRYEK